MVRFRRPMVWSISIAAVLIIVAGCGRQSSDQRDDSAGVNREAIQSRARAGSFPAEANAPQNPQAEIATHLPKPKSAAPTPPPTPPPPPWQLLTLEGAEASLDVAPDGSMKVAIDKASGEADWHVRLIGPAIPLDAGKTHSVSFRCRAAEPRSLVVLAVKGQTPAESVGLVQQISVDKKWQSFRLDFKPQDDADQARLRFNLGASSAGVEFADIAFGPQRLVLRADGDSTASMEVLPGFATAVRVTPGAAIEPEKSRRKRLESPLFPVVEGEEYYVSLRGRAQEPRKVITQVAMGHEPWKSLGGYRSIELGTAWQSHGFSFKATATDSQAVLLLMLGESGTPVELQSATVRPASAWRLVAAPDFDAVLTFPPADSQRQDVSGTGGQMSGDLMRVDVGRQPEPEPWRVRLVAAPRSALLDANYEIVFKARAERPREIVASVREDRDIKHFWLWAPVLLTEEWQTFSQRFKAKTATDHAVFAFELGGSDAAVEIADVELREAGRENP